MGGRIVPPHCVWGAATNVPRARPTAPCRLWRIKGGRIVRVPDEAPPINRKGQVRVICLSKRCRRACCRRAGLYWRSTSGAVMPDALNTPRLLGLLCMLRRSTGRLGGAQTRRMQQMVQRRLALLPWQRQVAQRRQMAALQVAAAQQRQRQEQQQPV